MVPDALREGSAPTDSVLVSDGVPVAVTVGVWVGEGEAPKLRDAVALVVGVPLLVIDPLEPHVAELEAVSVLLGVMEAEPVLLRVCDLVASGVLVRLEVAVSDRLALAPKLLVLVGLALPASLALTLMEGLTLISVAVAVVDAEAPVLRVAVASGDGLNTDAVMVAVRERGRRMGVSVGVTEGVREGVRVELNE